MTARDPHEPHRVSTTLELLFDLCFVVAVAGAAAHLHHGIAAGHAAHAVGSFILVFFAVWWAWMNYTWFASAYDSDDVPYRLKTLGQMAGALVLAAGVPRAFEHQDFSLVTVGYAIMRMMMIAQWLRAASGDPPRRATCRRYAFGIALCQLGWIAALALPPGWWLAAWFVLAPAEVLVPVWAERLAMTTWHPHHIAERYGLMTIIVLGESVLSATVAIQRALEAGHASMDLIWLSGGGLVLLFAMWWCYFELPTHGPRRSG
ncbi:MAG TPA: low temperature requirement protein A, partial [Planctomycetota bacterium]|nr:low temperature requirement protein A [Planctomycetota bacterium]